MAEHEPMLEMFIFETRQFLEQLEQLSLSSEKSGTFSTNEVNEIFRAMHTIKGSAAMMMVNEVSSLAHSVEDIFYYIRESHPKIIDGSSITDLILGAVDFIRGEIDKIDAGGKANESSADQRAQMVMFLRMMKEANGENPDVDSQKKKKTAEKVCEAAVPAAEVKQQYYISAAKEKIAENVYAAVIFFEDGCEMEEVRSYAVLNTLSDKVEEIHYKPEDLLDDDMAVDTIRKVGFQIWFTTNLNFEEVETQLNQTIFMEKLELRQLKNVAECEFWPTPAEKAIAAVKEAELVLPKIEVLPKTKTAAEGHEIQSMISVKVDKLDHLMDLVGELVIAESMVTQNPDIRGLELENFAKAARQLHKLNGELQDSVMAIRMVPVEGTFRKMNRLVRDMAKNLEKKVQLVLVGETTEVDKNINEHISDPLMHIIRNAVDHGIELPEERRAAGKPEIGKITLMAENAGGEVVIHITDDGAGLNREKILKRARENHLFSKAENELTDKEIYSFIFAPGFSTK
ncbi:MAG: chemotaxis protein CheA, partial [Selenomonadaceae bacterium]